MIRAVLDTNVLVSGLLFGGIPGSILDLVFQGRVHLLISPPIAAEYLRVLSYPKFQLHPDEIDTLLTGYVLPFCQVIQDPTPGTWSTDPDDDMFMACALAGKAHSLISGDTHLLDIQSPPVRVVTPAHFLEEFKDA